MDDMLSQIFNDPEKLKGAISMAASMLGGDTMQEPAAQTNDGEVRETAMDDMLSQIFNDPEKLKGAISMAASMLGGDTMQEPAPEMPPASAEPPPSYEPPDGGAYDPSAALMKKAMPVLMQIARSGQNAVSPGGAYDPSAALMKKAMPVLMQIARSGQNAVSPQKLELLHALKPFVAEHVGVQIDHGLRLVSIAQMAHAAMQQFRAGQDGGATHV